MKHCIILRKKKEEEQSFSVEVYRGLDALPSAAGNLLVRSADFFLSPDYLGALERSCSQEMKFLFAVAFEEKIPVAITYYQVLALSGAELRFETPDSDSKLTRWLKEKLSYHTSKLKLKILVNGNAFVTGEHGWFFAKEMEARTRSVLLEKLAQLTLEAADEEISLVVVKDFHENGDHFNPSLKQFKYRDFMAEPNMVLELDPRWNTFEEYFAAMTKKYRQRGKNILKKIGPVVKRELSPDELGVQEKQIRLLYESVMKKANFRLTKIGRGYFRGLKTELKQKMGTHGYFLDEELIAFRTSFRTGQGLECHYIGLDYSKNREFDIYQNMLFDYVREAFEYGERKVIFGRTAGEMKSNFGARPEQMVCYLKYRNHISNKLIKPFVRMVKPSGWTMRNPFRE